MNKNLLILSHDKDRSSFYKQAYNYGNLANMANKRSKNAATIVTFTYRMRMIYA